MCWTISYKPIKQQSDIDIVVYKILHPYMISPFRDYQYRYNQIQPSVDLKINYLKHHDVFEIYQGYHSYETIDVARNMNRWQDLNGHIYECIIPAYTDFYVNKIGEVVSSSLIVKKKLTILNLFWYNVCILWSKIKERIRDI